MKWQKFMCQVTRDYATMIIKPYPNGKYPYQIATRDILMLCVFMRPHEIVYEFGKHRVPAESTIYQLLKDEQFSRKEAMELIRKDLLTACPDDMQIDTWDGLVGEGLQQAKSLLLARVWRKISLEEDENYVKCI